MNIIFVRHGQTDWNILKKLQGRVDIQLNDEGRAQAKVARDVLKDEKIDLYSFDRMYAGRLPGSLWQQRWNGGWR